MEARVALVTRDKTLNLPEPWLPSLEKGMPFPAGVRTVRDGPGA